MNYKEALKMSDALNEDNDCAIIAIAIATNTPYTLVRNEFAKSGRKSRKYAYSIHTNSIVAKLGFRMQRMTVQSTTVRSLPRELRTGTYLVRIEGHILCLKNGKIEDSSEAESFHIREVCRITRKELTPVKSVTTKELKRVKSTPARNGSVKETIYDMANTMWNENGQPLEKSVLLKLRKNIMDVLEKEHGVNRNTASTVLGNWQKTL
jgi:hypothetical protein